MKGSCPLLMVLMGGCLLACSRPATEEDRKALVGLWIPDDGSHHTVEFKKDGMFGAVIRGNDETNPTTEQADIIRVKTTTLHSLLQLNGAPREIDYVSLDIEGSEEDVLKDFPFSIWRIKCLTIERPSGKLRDILARNDFRLVKEIPGLDCFYLHSEYLSAYLSNVFAFYEKVRLVWSPYRTQ